jgi:hypothetical protein
MIRSRPHARSGWLVLRRSGAGLLAAIAAAAACAGGPAEAPAFPAAGEWRSFEGTWSAAGERRTLELGGERSASVLDLSGSILLTGERGLGVGFHGRAIAFSDGTASSVGRAVWTDERGDRIFSDLHGAPVESGARVVGTITGGTGRWAGITGEYRLDWAWVMSAGEDRVQGRAIGLRGRARIVPAGGTR